MHEPRGTAEIDHTLHGGAAPTRVQWYFREQTALPVAVQRWELPPGGGEGPHVHPAGDAALEELYVLVSGTAVMDVDGTTHRLAPGDAVLAPAGSDHDLRNPGDEPAVLLVVFGPPGTALDWRDFGTGRATHAAAQAVPGLPASPPE